VPSTERIYGYVNFVLRGKEFRMPVYQSRDLMNSAEYADYLFFPFSDKTNGSTTYAGGRYIDLRIPKEGNTIIIDFNKAYNPYCAYNKAYSCPLIPEENQMDIDVLAGVGFSNPETVEEKVVVRNEVHPEYPGGYEALMKFIGKHIRYPEAAAKQNLEGSVQVQFVIETDGTVSSIRTLKGLSPECDREAERVISLMPKWKPAKLNGETVRVQFTLPVKFKKR
jgi:TonB family protein